jgi:DNA-binding transcriptional regulator YiaG
VTSRIATTSTETGVAVATAEARELLATGTAERIRRRAGISLAAVARVVGVEPSTVLMWERGAFSPSGERAVGYVALLRELCETTDKARRVKL